MGKVKKRNVIIIIIILIALSIVFFFVKSNSYQKRIEKILDSAFQENSYNKINDKKYITEKDGFVSCMRIAMKYYGGII